MDKLETIKKYPIVDQNVIQVRWWSTPFMLHDWLWKNSDGSDRGQCACSKHKRYWSKMTHDLVCNDNVIEEFIIPDENQIIRQIRQMIKEKSETKNGN